MPANQTALLAAISVFVISVVVFLNFYGPSQRSYVSPPVVLSVDTSDQIAEAWKSKGVKGRVAICFTRYLNMLETKESKELLVTELAMDHGVIRKVFHVVPESAWPEVQKTLTNRDDMRRTPEGFIGIFNNGRVYISPLTKLSPIHEKALIVLEPAVWSREELSSIVTALKSGRISSDLVIIIRGSKMGAETLGTTQTR